MGDNDYENILSKIDIKHYLTFYHAGIIIHVLQ